MCQFINDLYFINCHCTELFTGVKLCQINRNRRTDQKIKTQTISTEPSSCFLWNLCSKSLFPGGRTRSSSAGTVFCSQVLRARSRPRPHADRPCLSSSQTRTSTASERPKFSSGPVRWLCWRGWEARGCVSPLWSSRAGSEDGWHGSDTPGSAGLPSPYRDTGEELWPDGEDGGRSVCVCVCERKTWTYFI